jgi:hypothetical protein
MPVGDSPDLQRILHKVPRRPPIDPYSPTGQAVVEMEMARYGLGDVACECRKIEPNRFVDKTGAPRDGCIRRLFPMQAIMLRELRLARGLIAQASVGGGKAAVGILAPLALGVERSLMFVPASLVDQIEADYKLVAQHFRVPSIVIHKSASDEWRKIIPGMPLLHVLPYSLISTKKMSAWIDNLEPDAIIADECFPAETLVTTDVGDVPIGDVVDLGVGTYALARDLKTGVDGWRLITARARKPAVKRMVSVHHTRGTFTCTEDHKIWTLEDGYVKASALHANHTLTVCPVRQGLQAEAGVEEVLLESVWVHGANRQDDSATPEEPRRSAADSDPYLSRVREAVSGRGLPGQLHVQQEMRERKQEAPEENLSDVQYDVSPEQDRSSTLLASVCRGESGAQETSDHQADVDAGLSSLRRDVSNKSTRQEHTQTLFPELRDEYGEPRLEETLALASAKDETLGFQPQRRDTCRGPGQTEDRDLERARVVRVEVLESGSAGGSLGCARPNFVYDLTVEEHHNYYADGVLVSNCDSFSNLTSSRTMRLMRFFSGTPEMPREARLKRANTIFCGWTGSLTNSKISEFAHLLAVALKYNSPLPLDPEEVENWGRCLDATDSPCPPGALEALCSGEDEDVYDAFHRRLAETLGFLSVQGAPILSKAGTVVENVIREREIETIPDIVRQALEIARDFKRPDSLAPGDEFGEDEWLEDPLEQARVVRQVASGMYYRRIYPRGEPKSLIKRWLVAQKNWRKEVRGQMLRGLVHLDSPTLCEEAARRAWGDDRPVRGLPDWRAEAWPAWRDVCGLVKPGTEAVRLHPFLVDDAAQWALESPGIVWYTMKEFAEWLGEKTGLTVHEGGPGAGKRLMAENGKRSIIASVASHGRGRDRMQYSFSRQLLAQILASDRRFQQLFGRLDRAGQPETHVFTDVYLHVPEIKKSLEQAKTCGRYVQRTTREERKLLKGWRDGT